MVQVIQDFLVSFLGDIAFTNKEGALTLMQLVSYIITLGIFSFVLMPIISLFRGRNK